MYRLRKTCILVWRSACIDWMNLLFYYDCAGKSLPLLVMVWFILNGLFFAFQKINPVVSYYRFCEGLKTAKICESHRNCGYFKVICVGDSNLGRSWVQIERS